MVQLEQFRPCGFIKGIYLECKDLRGVSIAHFTRQTGRSFGCLVEWAGDEGRRYFVRGASILPWRLQNVVLLRC